MPRRGQAFAWLYRKRFTPPRDHLFNHVPKDVSQSEVPALEWVSELGVIETEQLEQGCVQIVDVDFLLRSVEPGRSPV